LRRIVVHIRSAGVLGPSPRVLKAYCAASALGIRSEAALMRRRWSQRCVYPGSGFRRPFDVFEVELILLYDGFCSKMRISSRLGRGESPSSGEEKELGQLGMGLDR
jgi:hypothetical protein